MDLKARMEPVSYIKPQEQGGKTCHPAALTGNLATFLYL